MKAASNKSASFAINLMLVFLSLTPIALLELFLLSIDYGYKDQLFLLDQTIGEYELNTELYRKYFSFYPLTNKSRIPELFPQKSFAAQKGDNDFRIFCLGGSTTRGDFSDNRFPDLLAEMLVRSEVEKNIEVINLGITTLNSYQIADFVAELVNYEPDLLIIYMGHNEIYGPLGVGSSSQISSSYLMTRTILSMQQLRTFQLLQNFYHKLFDDDTKEKREVALFKAMANISIEPFSPLRNKSVQNYAKNLDKIITNVEKKGVPLVLCTIASNIRDFRPFDSELPKDVIGMQWQSFIDSALLLKDKGQFQNAVEIFLHAIELYPENAQQYFDLGHTYIALEKYDKALESLIRAKDFDIIPFRAPSGINKIIRQKTEESSSLLLDVEKIYNNKSVNGLIGKPIMVEHLHPSAYGHYLIAAGLVEVILKNGLLQPGKKINFDDPAVQVTFNAAINSEDFDGSEMWPFSINNKDYRFP